MSLGWPKLPQNLEAVILHSLDELDGKIQAMHNLLAQAQGLKWTVFHRACRRIWRRTVTPGSVAERLTGGMKREKLYCRPVDR
jgi:iron uptake system EfeUOB component EfeO/EfeM